MLSRLALSWSDPTPPTRHHHSTSSSTFLRGSAAAAAAAQGTSENAFSGRLDVEAGLDESARVRRRGLLFWESCPLPRGSVRHIRAPDVWVRARILPARGGEGKEVRGEDGWGAGGGLEEVVGEREMEGGEDGSGVGVGEDGLVQVQVINLSSTSLAGLTIQVSRQNSPQSPPPSLSLSLATTHTPSHTHWLSLQTKPSDTTPIPSDAMVYDGPQTPKRWSPSLHTKGLRWFTMVPLPLHQNHQIRTRA